MNIGRKMMASLASGIFVHTAARTVMIAPDWRWAIRINIFIHMSFNLLKCVIKMQKTPIFLLTFLS